ncbi:MAG: hypothetical protein ABT940_08200 [Alphaproteobacteria bacterium]
MEFTPADRDSVTWQKLKTYLQARLQTHRTRNDGRMSEADRNFLIGQIFEVQTILGLEQPKLTMKG